MTAERWDYFTVSQKVFDGPGRLMGYVVAGDGAASSADIYDGVDAGGKHLFHITVLDNTTWSAHFGQGVALEQGLYVVLADANVHVSVGYKTGGL